MSDDFTPPRGSEAAPPAPTDPMQDGVVKEQPGSVGEGVPVDEPEIEGDNLAAENNGEVKKDKKKKKKKKKNCEKKNAKGKKDKKAAPGGGSTRSVETMFRTSYRTHLDLSSLADNKANIMISINGIIISVLLASIYPRITENQWLLLPTAVLILTCLLSLVYAVLSARPRVTRQNVTLDDVRSDKANILFFGTFVNMKEEDFVVGMRELIMDPGRAYGNMIRDIYGLGRVLEKKYRLLRISYTIFMLGLIVGVTLFLTVFSYAGLQMGGF